jgi:hypothetical protein
MTRRRNCRVASALVGMFIAPAGLWPSSVSAEDAVLTIEPSTVETPGEYSFTIEGEGWTPSTVYLLDCEVPPSGLAEDVDNDLCDTSTAKPIGPRDGAFSFAMVLEVGAEGLALGVGDPDRTQSAAVIVTVGATPDEVLAETGAFTLWIAALAATMVGLGWVLLACVRWRVRSCTLLG